tara:strand:- start:342 stop:956 length:615 start_codon:yes stop_codon:yes gene_type:complete
MTIEQTREIYKETAPLTTDNLGGRALKAAGLCINSFPDDLRFHPKWIFNGLSHPAIAALVRDIDGEVVGMDMFALEGGGFADVEPSCAAEYSGGNYWLFTKPAVISAIGYAWSLADGLAAQDMFGVPVMVAVPGQEVWTPPCPDVYLFPENSEDFSAQATGYQLANDIAVQGGKPVVHIPFNIGSSWGDVAMEMMLSNLELKAG